MKNTRRLFIKLSGILSLGIFNKLNALNTNKSKVTNSEGLLDRSYASGLEEKEKRHRRVWEMGRRLT